MPASNDNILDNEIAHNHPDNQDGSGSSFVEDAEGESDSVPTELRLPEWYWESNEDDQEEPVPSEPEPIAWDWRRDRKENELDVSRKSSYAYDPYNLEKGKTRPEPLRNPDLKDNTAPWTPINNDDDDNDNDEDDDECRPMIVPADFDDKSWEYEKETPKGIAVPVYSFLNVAVLAVMVGGGALAGGGIMTPASNNGRGGRDSFTLWQAPTLLSHTTGPPDVPPILPSLQNPPILPCGQDFVCGYVLEIIAPALPPQTRPLLNVPGTCQNWSREWLRTGKDIMQFQVHRIRQRFAMAMMYCEFDGDHWLESELWVSDLHECDWYTMSGVDPCSRDEAYQIIRNTGQQIRGTLPPEIAMMTTLREITLSDNLLEGPIPEEYSRLSELDTLILSFNLFRGPIPDFIWEFEDLVYMDLGHNFFHSSIPETAYLTSPNLQILLLESNDMVGSIPPEFATLDFKRLHLDSNQFEGPIPVDLFQKIPGKRTKHGLEKDRSLEELYLNGNNFEGRIPSGIANLFRLKDLKLHDNQLSGDINEICPKVFAGTLSVVADLASVSCACCSNGHECEIFVFLC